MEAIDKELQAQDRDQYLIHDVGTARRNCQQHDSQFNRRTLVRTVFACIEAMVYGLQQECLDLKEASTAPLPISDPALLKEGHRRRRACGYEMLSVDGGGNHVVPQRFSNQIVATPVRTTRVTRQPAPGPRI